MKSHSGQYKEIVGMSELRELTREDQIKMSLSEGARVGNEDTQARMTSHTLNPMPWRHKPLRTTQT